MRLYEYIRYFAEICGSNALQMLTVIIANSIVVIAAVISIFLVKNACRKGGYALYVDSS